jgi:hypothetical protein
MIELTVIGGNIPKRPLIRESGRPKVVVELSADIKSGSAVGSSSRNQRPVSSTRSHSQEARSEGRKQSRSQLDEISQLDDFKEGAL